MHTASVLLEPVIALDAVVDTAAWRDAHAVLTKAMTDFFQLPFAAVAPNEHDEAFVAEISLSAPTKQLELGLSVVVTVSSMTRLGVQLLGEDDLEGSEALVLEAANILMGTLKTAFSAHAIAFTGGLPVKETLGATRSSFLAAPVRSRLAISAGGSDVELWLRVTRRTNVVVRGRALTEGLVLREDILDEHGVVIVKSGTRLTQTSVDRVARLAPDLEIAVSDPTA